MPILRLPLKIIQELRISYTMVSFVPKPLKFRIDEEFFVHHELGVAVLLYFEKK